MPLVANGVQIPIDALNNASPVIKQVAADVQGLETSANDAGRGMAGLNSNSGSFLSTSRDIGLSLTTWMSVFETIKNVGEATYAFAREGASLELVETRFDRLATSIGTTGDALKNDLTDATRGLYSNAELMQNATELMALGLVKDQNEAVRLASVSAGLNMNMNQLVLTLTNMTTMRFDALGVSVDGFKEKMKLLEKQGYSTNDAFKEAFLQQAESQLEKVGNAADTSLGAFMRYEAALKDVQDQAKMTSSEGIAPLIGYLADSTIAIVDNKEKLHSLNEELYKEYSAHKVLTPEMEALIGQYERGAAMTEFYKNKIGETTTATQELAGVTEEEAKAQSNYFESVLKGAESSYQKQEDYNRKLDETKAKYGEGSIEVQKLKESHGDAMAQMQYDLLLTQLKTNGLTQEEYGIAVAAGVGFGVFDQEAADAQIAQLELTNAVAAGKIGVGEYGWLMKNAMADGVITAKELKDMIGSIPGSKTFTLQMITVGGIPTFLNDQSARATVAQGKRYAEGTDGWMTVPPGYPNDSYPVMMQSGERFAVIPAGVNASPMAAGGGMNGGGATIVFAPTIQNLFGTQNETVSGLYPAFVEMLERAKAEGHV